MTHNRRCFPFYPVNDEFSRRAGELFGLLMILFLAASPMFLAAQSEKAAPLGIAWEVRGAWTTAVGASTVHTGDAIQPGALLHPEQSNSDHSITILLPDGERVLYECFTTEDCARGFRVPALYLKPDAFNTGILARVRAVLASSTPVVGTDPQAHKHVPQDEAAAVIGPDNKLEVGGLAAKLQNGRYTCDIRTLGGASGPSSQTTIDKTSRVVSIGLPGPGIYDLTIADSQGKPRINLLAAAIGSSQKAAVLQPFERAREEFKEWNENYQGWPIHEFQRAYLESLMLGIPPQMEHSKTVMEARREGITAEPQFTPKPGVFKGDTTVALRCETPGAAIHYTVDGSQPFLSSPKYGAPVSVKGTELTIKAFATAPGAKDSPVVTGIFRIAE